MNLSKNVKITRVMNAVAAGQAANNGDILDMSGFDGVVFVCALGTVTDASVVTMKAQQDALNGAGAMTDLVGATVSLTASTDSNQCLLLDLYRPEKRYVRCVVTTATQNAGIDGVIAIQYSGRYQPVTQSASIDASTLSVSPSE